MFAVSSCTGLWLLVTQLLRLSYFYCLLLILLFQTGQTQVADRSFLPRVLHASPDVQRFIDIIDALKISGLEYTRVYPGYFMDYWGVPNVRTHIRYFAYGVDICNARAVIPGDGNDLITMTYSYDMAEFVVHLMDLPSWPESSYIAGDDITFNRILDLAQTLRGNFLGAVAFFSSSPLDVE